MTRIGRIILAAVFVAFLVGVMVGLLIARTTASRPASVPNVAVSTRTTAAPARTEAPPPPGKATGAIPVSGNRGASPSPSPAVATKRPVAKLPTPAPGPSARPPAMPGHTALASISGLASWYAWHVGEAAAGPGLRAFLGAGWRGTVVRVTAGSRSVVVRLTDFMVADRLVDLDSRSFAVLAPLSAGLVRVVVA